MRIFFFFSFIYLCHLVSFGQGNTDISKIYEKAELAYDSGQYSLAIEIALEGINIEEQAEDDSVLIDLLTTASHSADYLGRYDQCQDFNYQLLERYQSNKDTLGIASALNDISIIHYYKGDYNSSLNYAEKSLDIHNSLKDTIGIAMSYNNMANCYADNGEIEKGLDFYFRSLELYDYLNDAEGQAICYSNIGDTYQVLNQYDSAEKNFLAGLAICNNNNLDDWYKLTQYLGMSKLLLKQQEGEKALFYAEKALQISDKSNYRAEKCTSYILCSEALEMMGNYKESLINMKLYSNLNDSIYKDENSNAIEVLNAKYNLAEKEKEIKQQKVLIDREKVISNRTKWVIIILILFFVVVILFSIVLYKENKKNKWTNQVLNETNDFLEQNFKDVRESIQYARKIQDSILPDTKNINASFPDSFVYYQPKDVVSGDFYWFDKVDNISLLAVVDCTGHGVPGAFMSMMASNLLNQVVLDKDIRHPSSAFEMLDERLKYNLHQDTNEISSNDGFDLSLIAYHEKEGKIEYCGAKNDLYLISDGELVIKKASRSSIGGNLVNKKFVGHNFDVKAGDSIFLFTDGFADQFGGVKDKKISYSKLRSILLENHTLPMQKQKEKLTSFFNDWKGNKEQIDDICIVGIKF